MSRSNMGIDGESYGADRTVTVCCHSCRKRLTDLRLVYLSSSGYSDRVEEVDLVAERAYQAAYERTPYPQWRDAQKQAMTAGLPAMGRAKSPETANRVLGIPGMRTQAKGVAITPPMSGDEMWRFICKCKAKLVIPNEMVVQIVRDAIRSDKHAFVLPAPRD